MTLHRLAVRTKKSLSGLYSSQKENVQLSSEPGPRETTKSQITPPKTLSSALDEFGIVRSDDDASPSPGKDSPSRRQRLMGSLRGMRSLRSLRSMHSNPKKSEEEPVELESPQTPVKATPSLSLNFEASPADEPMFDPMTRTVSGSSSLKVHHSSPITMPAVSRHSTPVAPGTPSGLAMFPVGTVPDSPAPLLKESVQEAIINNVMRESPSPGSTTVDVVAELPTPMPGTNLPLEANTAPDIMVTSPSAPSMLLQGDNAPGYFDMAVVPDESSCERSSTLLTESGFPTFGDANCTGMTTPTAKPDDAVWPESDTASTCPEQANIDGAAWVFPRNTTPTIEDRKFSSVSTDYGEGLAYVVWDNPTPPNGEKDHGGRSSNWGRHSGLYDGTGYGGDEPATRPCDWANDSDPWAPRYRNWTDNSHQWIRASRNWWNNSDPWAPRYRNWTDNSSHWARGSRSLSEHSFPRANNSSDWTGSSRQATDNTEGGTTETTAWTEFTSPEEEASEAKLMAAIKQLDPAKLRAKLKSSEDDSKALREFVRAYHGRIYREGTQDDDSAGGVSLRGDVTPEMREDVETSIRVMNQSLGG